MMALLYRLHHWLYGEEPLVPKEIREASHEQANQTARLKASLHKWSQKDDPVESFIEAMSKK